MLGEVKIGLGRSPCPQWIARQKPAVLKELSNMCVFFSACYRQKYNTTFSWIKITQPGRHPIEHIVEFKARHCLDTSLQGTESREVAKGEQVYGL